MSNMHIFVNSQIIIMRPHSVYTSVYCVKENSWYSKVRLIVCEGIQIHDIEVFRFCILYSVISWESFLYPLFFWIIFVLFCILLAHVSLFVIFHTPLFCNLFNWLLFSILYIFCGLLYAFHFLYIFFFFVDHPLIAIQHFTQINVTWINYC